LSFHPGEDVLGALEDGHADADTVEDLAPLQRDVAATEYYDTFGEIALFENRLARVVVDVVEAINGRFPR
jgi:hypothetical protein